MDVNKMLFGYNNNSTMLRGSNATLLDNNNNDEHTNYIMMLVMLMSMILIISCDLRVKFINIDERIAAILRERALGNTIPAPSVTAPLLNEPVNAERPRLTN